MKLQGVSLDFDDMRSCGLLPDLCADWDHGSEELSENQKLLSYWDNNVKEVLDKTDKVVLGNIGTKSVLYSADKDAIELIKKQFKEMEISSIDYDKIDHCENCIKVDYLAS